MLPEPFHPVVVHFPIVLTVLGCGAVLLALIWRRGHLPLLSAIFLAMGAATAGVAYLTGDEAKDNVGVLAKPAEQLLDQHEEWAESTLVASIIAAGFAWGTVLTGRWPRWSWALHAFAVAGALATLWCITWTGHYGGQMVYHHRVGVHADTSGSAAAVAHAQP